jgi:hypothetical protein
MRSAMDKGAKILQWLRRGWWAFLLTALAIAVGEVAVGSGTHAGTGATTQATQERISTGVQAEGCPTLPKWNWEWEGDPDSPGTEGPIHLR